jgi:hypothetical protein
MHLPIALWRQKEMHRSFGAAAKNAADSQDDNPRDE